MPVADPPAPPGANGWAPADLRVVRSRHVGGFPGATARFAFGGVEEHRGQRLTTAQIDEFAPYFAKQYGMHESFVRAELAKVYVYIGGPSANQNAMTIGHHIFLPDEESLRKFERKDAKRWMAHELAHVMQFDVEHGRNVPRYLADYVGGFVVGNAPDTGPGHADGGRPVWGSLFTAVQMAGKREDQLGAPATTLRDRLTVTALPGAVIGGTGGLIAGGLFAASAASRGGGSLLGLRAPFRTGAAVFALPALAGAGIGAAGGVLGGGTSAALGGLAGAATGAAVLGAAGAFAKRSPLQLAGIAGALVGAGALGAGMAYVSASTTRGWSPTTAVRTDQGRDVRSHEFGYGDALHDGHWYELDAEATARQYLRGDTPHDTGRTDVPSDATSPKRKLQDRFDWGVKLPLILGVPAAGAIGIGVLGARTLGEVGNSVLARRPGHNKIADALFALGTARRGVGNSLAIGGALGLAPLVAGGIAGQFTGSIGSNPTIGGSIGGGAAGAATGAGLLALCLKGRASGAGLAIRMTAGTVLAGALGTIAGSAAANAMHPRERGYIED